MNEYTLLKCGLTDMGQFIPKEDNIFSYVENQNNDYYYSIYYFNEEHKKKAEELITINGHERKRGISGITDVKTNRLIFDFDSETDLELARKDVLQLCDRLASHGLTEEDVIICFSGSKGFSVELNTDKELTPTEFKNIVRSLASDLFTFDSKIYNPVRVFRLPFTRHKKGKAYKTPISYGILCDNDAWTIKNDIAKYKSKIDNTIYHKCKLPDSIYKLRIEKKKEVVKVLPSIKTELDFKNKPKFLSNWKYALLNGYFPSGCRSYAMMVLAATFKVQGFPEQVTGRMLKGAAELQAQREGGEVFPKKEIWENCIKQVYGPLWNGGSYAEDNFPDELKNYLIDLGLDAKEKKEEVFHSIDDVFNTFTHFAENIEANTIKTGIAPLDKMMQMTTSMLVGLLGSPSSGKTSICLEIMRNMSIKGEACLFFSMDMGAPLVYQKLAQKVSGKSPKEIQKRFLEGDNDFKTDIRDKINNNFSNVDITFKTALTVENIRSEVEQYQEQSGKKIRLIVIDYLECINLPTSDVNTGISFIAQQLKDLANDLEVCVLLLLQPPKHCGDVSNPLLSYTNIKGAATLAQACSVVFSIYREGFNPSDTSGDRFLTLSILKNRMGQLGSVDMGWIGLTGSVYELDDSEKMALKAIREGKKDNNKKDDFF